MTDPNPHINYSIPITSLVALVLIISIVAWNERGEDVADLSQVERGQTIYANLCAAACHHMDPNQEIGTEGTYGPPIAGVSFELMKMRVLSVQYPEGYTPKRTTSNMTTFVLRDTSLLQLHAFLEDAAKKAGGK